MTLFGGQDGIVSLIMKSFKNPECDFKEQQKQIKSVLEARITKQEREINELMNVTIPKIKSDNEALLKTTIKTMLENFDQKIKEEMKKRIEGQYLQDAIIAKFKEEISTKME